MESWNDLESPSADMAKSKGAKKKSIQEVCAEMKAIVDEAGYEMGDVLKSMQMDSAQPDDSMDMEEADEAVSEDSDEPEHGGEEGGDREDKKAMVIAMLKKKQGMME